MKDAISAYGQVIHNGFRLCIIVPECRKSKGPAEIPQAPFSTIHAAGNHQLYFTVYLTTTSPSLGMSTGNSMVRLSSWLNLCEASEISKLLQR